MSADCESVLPYIKPGWVGVEIGVSRGNSALAFLDHGVKFLWLVDPWTNYSEYPESNPSSGYYDGVYKEAMDRLSVHAGKHGHLRMLSKDAVRYIPGPVDFVFIDGNHTYDFVKDDCERYWPLIRSGGKMCGHDYCNAPPTCEVKRAVDEFYSNHGIVAMFQTFDDVSSCWIIHKP
jgi:hypothetical protein